MSTPTGYFVDWGGNARSAAEPGGGYVCEVDTAARYVAVTTRNGTLVHEASWYKTLADIEKAGIKAPLVPADHPWGKADEGF